MAEPKRYEDLNWSERERFHRRRASLNTLSDKFGVSFLYEFSTEKAQAFIQAHRCVVPMNYRGEP